MTIAKETFDALIALSIVLGLFYCFLGYKIFKIVLGILGFAIGAALGGALAYGSSGGEGGSTLIAALLAGAVGAALFVVLYFVGTFLLGAGTGALLGVLFFQASGSGSPPVELIMILAIIGGILAVILQKFVIIVSTSFVGSWTIITGVFYFVEPLPYRAIAIGNFNGVFRVPARLGLTIVLWILLGIAGVVVQYRRVEMSKEKEAPKPTKSVRPEIEIEGTGDRTAAAQINQEKQTSSELLEERPAVNKGGFLILDRQLPASQDGDADERTERESAESDEGEYDF